MVSLNLKVESIAIPIDRMNAEQSEAVIELNKLLTFLTDQEILASHLKKYDKDNSHSMTLDELVELMNGLGLRLPEERWQYIVTTYSLLENGAIDYVEFYSFAKNEAKIIQEKIRSLSTKPCVVESSQASVQYVPPTTGYITWDIYDNFEAKDNYKVLNTIDEGRIQHAAQSAGNISEAVAYSLNICKIRLDEALKLYNILLQEIGDTIGALELILPHMESAEESQYLLSTIFEKNTQGLNRLRHKMPFELKVILGEYNGYYQLHMSNASDRSCLKKLYELSCRLNMERRDKCPFGLGRVGDTSQKGNWTCFRNERRNGQPIVIDSTTMHLCLKSGKVEFDFSTVARPALDRCSILDARFVMNLVELQLVAEDNYQLELDLLSRNTFPVTSLTKYECSISRGWDVNQAVINFSSSLCYRADMYKSIVDREIVRNEDISVPDMHGNSTFLNRMGSSLISILFVEAKVLLGKIVSTFIRLWISCRHLVRIIELFESGTIDRGDCFGTYRVEAVVELFPRLIDLCNFEIVLRALEAREVGIVYCRLGWLNIFNPMKPEGGMVLDLSVWEMRQVVKMIVRLSVDEPGNNIVDGKFRFDLASPYIPGWEVTTAWLKESSLMTKGFISLFYYSGEGCGKGGCIPNMELRRSLWAMTLIDEKHMEMQPDAAVNKCYNHEKTFRYIRSRQALWLEYLCALPVARPSSVTGPLSVGSRPSTANRNDNVKSNGKAKLKTVAKIVRRLL